MDIEHIVGFLRSFWTVWVMLIFVGIMAYAMWPSNKAKFERAANIPFRDEGQGV